MHHVDTDFAQLQGTGSHPTVPAATNAPPRRSTRRRRRQPAHTMAASVAAQPMLPDLDTLTWKDGWTAMKAAGNNFYAQANYLGAIDAYMRALDVVHANIPFGDVGDVTQARVLLHNNIAAAFLELGMFNLALREAEAACQLDDSNVKAILRRGKALYGLGDGLTAELMFRRVLEVATVGFTSERTDAHAYLAAINPGVPASHIVSDTQEMDTQEMDTHSSTS